MISDPERFAASTITTPTASPEMSRLRRGKSRARLPPEWHFRDQRALRHDRVRQVNVLGRIDVIVAARQHCNGTGRESSAVRGGIDATRQAGRDDETFAAEIVREPLGEANAGRRRIACSDHRDHGHLQDGAATANREQRRRA